MRTLLSLVVVLADVAHGEAPGAGGARAPVLKSRATDDSARAAPVTDGSARPVLAWRAARGGSATADRGGTHASHSLSFRGAPWFVLKCAYFAALDAMLLGYDIGVISGVIVFIRHRFSLTTHETELFASAINSAAIFGSLASGVLADRCGRKSTLFLSSTFFTVGSAVMALAPTYAWLLVGRLVQGLGIGAGLLVSPMFISELAPPKYRGSLVTLSEVSLSLGILLAYVANLALSGLPAQWRWMLAIGVLPGIALTLRIFFLPESPRWLLAHGRDDQARRVLRLTLGNDAKEREVAAATRDISAGLREETAAAASGAGTLLNPHTLRTVLVGIALAVCQHSVGIESIIYYSPLIFEKAGVASPRAAILGTVAMGAIKLACETFALLNVDSIGRRPLLLTGGLGLTASLILIGSALGVKLAGASSGVTPASLAVFAGLGSYMAFHALSFGPITWLVLSEIFPLAVRGRAMGLATTANRATSFVVAVSFLSLCERLKWSGAFFTYAAFAAAATLFYATCVPETTGLRLEEVFPLFANMGALVRTNLRSLPLVGSGSGSSQVETLLAARRPARSRSDRKAASAAT